MTRQEQILLEVAKKHNINIGKARHAFYCIGKKAEEIINHPDNFNEETGMFNTDKFKIFSIIKLGKFIPKTNYINRRNKIKQERHESGK